MGAGLTVLVPNLGSTSLKWKLFEFSSASSADTGDARVRHRGGFERVTDYQQAIDDCLDQMTRAGALASETSLAAVGFKTIIAKGITGCVRVDESVLRAMEAYIGLAPAHNPPYITGIRLFGKRMPDVPLIALFETAFYQFAPEPMMRYAVPDAWHASGVRRWGFHGASHKFIAERSAELLGRPDVVDRARRLYVNGGATRVGRPDLRVISCHLGGSSSVSGILNGVAVGNSLGMSPQSGVPHNNRVGDLDSAAVPYVMRTLRLTLEEAERQLTQDSGLKGLSGLSNDMRDIEAAAAHGDARAQLALDVFVAGVRHWIGVYLVAMNGADALVFTAGIGEHGVDLRRRICTDLDGLGIRLDAQRNLETRGREGIISAEDSAVKVLVIPTNEELVVAREAVRVLAAGAPAAAALSESASRSAAASGGGAPRALKKGV